MQLIDKKALVTGGGRGIGRAICLAFAMEGADVVVASEDAAENERTAADAVALGVRALPYAVDVSNWEEVREMADETLARFERIDILVNNAGINRRAVLVDSDVEEWKKVIEVIVYGSYHCCKAFVQTMIDRDYGRVITTASIAGKIAVPSNSSYAVAKHGLIGLTRTLAAEVAWVGAKGVTVNAICPGITNTDMITGPEGTMTKIAELLGITPEEVWEQIYKKQSLQERLLEPEEIASMAVFLASDDARGITGQSINVCGGSVLY